MGGENLGGSPLWYDTLSITQTWHLRFRAAALLAALALVPACAEHLNSFAFFGAIVSGGNVGGGGGGNGDMEEMKAYTTISLKKSAGGNNRK